MAYKPDSDGARLNPTKEKIDSEQYSNFTNPDKVRKLSHFIDIEFSNIQIDPSRATTFLESKRGEVFDSRDIANSADIDLEVSTFITEPAEPYDFDITFNTFGKNPEDEAIVSLNRAYKKDIDIKIILERKTRYHKEMVKLLKSVQQTRAAKLLNFLTESRNSSVSEYTNLLENINAGCLIGNYNLNVMFLPVHRFRNIEDIYYSIFLLNDIIEQERKSVETEEVTPTVIDDGSDIADDSSKHNESKTPKANTYYDPDHVHLVSKYHKMEKSCVRCFDELDLFQGPMFLLKSILAQENALKHEHSKLLSSLSTTKSPTNFDQKPSMTLDSFKTNIFESYDKTLKGFGGPNEKQIMTEIEDNEIERLDYVEERVQSMIEFLIAKGTCPFIEQTEGKNIIMKKISKALRVLKEKQKVSKDEENKNVNVSIGALQVTEQSFLKIFKHAGAIKAKNWKDTTDSDDQNIDKSYLKTELQSRISNSKTLMTKIQFLLDFLESNINSDSKQQKEAAILKSEGSQLIYEILVGKSFEIDAFQMTDPEIQKLRHERMLNSDPQAKPAKPAKEKAFINIFKPQDSITSPMNNLAFKKIPSKAIKRTGGPQGAKMKSYKFIPDQGYAQSGEKLIHDENILLALNHLVNYHYLLCQASFRYRAQLTISDDALFAYSCYKVEQLKAEKHFSQVLMMVKQAIGNDLPDQNYGYLYQNYKLSSIQVPHLDLNTRLESFVYKRLENIGVVAAREYQRCLDYTFKMLQTEPDERSEVDSVLKNIDREIQNRINRFLDMLVMGDENKPGSSGLRGLDSAQLDHEEGIPQLLNTCAELAGKAMIQSFTTNFEI